MKILDLKLKVSDKIPVLEQINKDLKEDIISYMMLYKNIEDNSKEDYENWKDFDISVIENYQNKINEFRREVEENES